MSTLVREGDVEFHVTPGYTHADLRKVQAKSLEMYREIAAVLDRHGIDYTLGYGSLLGQVRHAGYIPWDDDIDLFIMSEDYARAILHLRRELPDDLILHDKRNDPIYWVTWVKVRDLHSHTVESMWKIDRKFRYHGVAIDLIRVAETTSGRRRHGPVVKRLRAELSKKRRARPARRGEHRLGTVIWFAFPESLLRARINYHRLMQRISKRRLLIAAPGTVIERVFRWDHMYPIRPRGPLFEGMVVPTPNRPEGILRSMYGDFMRLPALEDRVPHFESVEFFGERDAPEGPDPHD